MERNQSKVNNVSYKDEIELRDLIMVLWNRKLLIIIISVVFALLAGLFSKFLTSEQYQTKFSIVANIPKVYNTKYGEYTLPLSSNMEYIRLLKSSDVAKKTIKDLGLDSEGISAEAINSRINIGSTTEAQSVFPISVTGASPEETVELANAIYDNFVKFVDLMIKERAINYYYNDFVLKLESNDSKLESSRDLLVRQKALLEVTPETINQKDALAEITGVKDIVILENIINPNYTHIEYQVLEIEQNINMLESSNEEYKRLIEELSTKKKDLSTYKESSGQGFFAEDLRDNIDIYKLSDPALPSSSMRPNTVRNVIIGGMLGFMMSVFVAFFLAYWKKEI